MVKRSPIVLDGKPLDAIDPLEIVDIAARRNRQRFDLGPCGDAYRNAEILEDFAGANERTSTEFVAAESARHRDWSEQFCALRVGERLGWAVENGIVQRVPYSPRWQLLQRQKLFEIVGGERNRHAIRVRGIADAAEHAAAQRLWNRELKRRERERLRDIEKYRPEIIRALDRIVRLAPDTKLEGYLERFAVGGYDTVASCKQYIIDRIDGLEGASPFVLSLELGKISRELKSPQKAEVEPIPVEDLAALKGLRL